MTKNTLPKQSRKTQANRRKEKKCEKRHRMERRDQMVTYARQLRTISDDLPDGPNRHGQMDTKTPTTRTTKPDKTTGETVRPDVPTETISGGKNDKWLENEPTVEQT